MTAPLTISDLRRCPEFFDIVAERIWQAWWRPYGHPRDYIRTRLRESIDAEPIPLALVAHAGSEFRGTASVIASDLDERPQLSPWVAAVWVEPNARRHGIGGTLVDQAVAACSALGIPRAYLCARSERAGFYERLGWTRIERNIGPSHLDVFSRDTGPAEGKIKRSLP